MIKKLFALFEDRALLVDRATKWERVALEWRAQLREAMGILSRSQASNEKYREMVDQQRRTIDNLRGFCDTYRKTIERLQLEAEKE